MIHFRTILRNEVNIDLNHFSIDSYCCMVIVKIHFFFYNFDYFLCFCAKHRLQRVEKKIVNINSFHFSIEAEMLVIVLVPRNRIKASTDRRIGHWTL